MDHLRTRPERRAPESRSLREFGAGTIEIFTLGKIRIKRGEADLTEKIGTRHQAILIYLAHEDRPVAPEELTSLLEGGGGEKREADALHRTISWLNNNYPGLDITITPESITMLGAVWLDSKQLSQALRDGEAEKALAIYKGNFLEGFTSPTRYFEEWVESERQRLRRMWSEAMRTAAAAAETAGRWSDATAWWRAIVDRDPLKEDAVARLILTLGLANEIDAAALAYSGYVTRLRELGTGEPADVVRRVARKLSLPEPVWPATPAGARVTDLGDTGIYIDPDELAGVDDAAMGKVVVLRPGLDPSLGSASKSQFFTESFVVHAIRTTWARLTTPRAVAGYRTTSGQLLAIVAEVLQVVATLVGGAVRGAWGIVASTGGRLRRLFRRRHRRSPPISATRPVPVSARSQRQEPKAESHGGAGNLARAPKPARRPLAEPLERQPSFREFATSESPFARTRRAFDWRARIMRSVSLAKLGVWVGGARRHPRIVLTALVAVAVLVAPQEIWDWAGERFIGARTALSAVQRPSLPEVSMPNLRLPKITVEIPEIVEGPVAKIGDMLTGVVASRGDRVIVADLEDRASGAPDAGQALALTLETQLSQATYFSTLPRERVVRARGRGSRTDMSLASADALYLAPAVGASFVITGVVSRSDSLYHAQLSILDLDGSEREDASGSAATLVAALDLAARELRHELGEPADDIDASQATVKVTSPSLEALIAYAGARGALISGRYSTAIALTAEAIRHDSTYAAAHRLAADAYAQAGQRRNASRALNSAWLYRIRLTARERLRLEADRLAFSGELNAAIASYDRLFSAYRDDAAALKSQAVLQEMIGARGGGLGNLQVAYSIDRQDWPPLANVARFLGYGGRLPEVESLIELASEADSLGRR